MTKPHVLLIGLGGTIVSVLDKNGALGPAENAEEIIKSVPSLATLADISYKRLKNLDSTNIGPNVWTELAYTIAEMHAQYNGIIVTGGTDTMAYTAGAVSLALGRKLEIPIVFTGSQLSLVEYGTDARFNLEWAVKTAVRAYEEHICEVMIVFNDLVLRANRAIKINESSFHAFDSPAFPHLGQARATGVEFIPAAFRNYKQLDFWQHKSLPRHKIWDIKPHFQRGVVVLEVVPGLEPDIIRVLCKSGTCRGLLLKGLGAGNVPTEGQYSLIPVIEEAVTFYKIPVLVCTKFLGGRTLMYLYDTGKKAVDVGAVDAGDLTDVMAQVKFMWALAQGYQSHDALQKIIHTSIASEITA